MGALERLNLALKILTGRHVPTRSEIESLKSSLRVASQMSAKERLEAGKLVEAAGQRIAVFNAGGKYWAIEDRCHHRGGPLSEGMLAEEEVICPWHGSRFNVKTGAVLTPPAQRNVKSFPVRIVGTDVEVASSLSSTQASS